MSSDHIVSRWSKQDSLPLKSSLSQPAADVLSIIVQKKTEST